MGVDCEKVELLISEMGLQDIYDNYWKELRIPTYGMLEITYHCNFRCVHCYADEKHTIPYLSFEQIKRIVDQVAEAGNFALTISGGDPLTHPDFKEIYKYIKSKGIFVEVFTNGTLIDEEIIELFKEYPPINVDITMYGASEETYHRVTQTIGSYNSFLKGIMLLEEANIKYTLKGCIIKENIDDLFEIQKFAREKGVNFRYSFELAPTIDGNTYVYDHRVDVADVLKYEMQDVERAEYWKNTEKGVIDLNKIPYGELPVYNCKTARFTFCVSADGYLSGCIHDRTNRYDLLHGTFAEGWNRVYDMVTRKKIIPGYKCVECECLPFCNSCPADVEREYKDIYSVNEYYCELAKLRCKIFKEGGADI